MVSKESAKALMDHIGAYKLQSQEKIHDLKWKVQKLKEANQDMAERLENFDTQVKDQQAHIIMLNKRFTTKYRVEERNDWRALVDSLNNDRRELNEQLDGLLQEKSSLEAQLLKARESAVHSRRRMSELEEAGAKNIDSTTEAVTTTPTAEAATSDSNAILLEQLQQERLRLQQELLREKQRAQERNTATALELQTHKQDIERLKLENQLLQQQQAQSSRKVTGGFLFGIGSALRLCGPAKKNDFDLSVTI